MADDVFNAKKSKDDEAKAVIDSGITAGATLLAAAHPPYAPLIAASAEMAKHVVNTVVRPKLWEFGRYFLPANEDEAREQVARNAEAVHQVMARLSEVDPCAIAALATLAKDYCADPPKRVDAAFRGFVSLFAAITQEHFDTLTALATPLEVVALKWNEPVFMNWVLDRHNLTGTVATTAKCYTAQHTRPEDFVVTGALYGVPSVARQLVAHMLAMENPPAQGAFFSDIDRGAPEWSSPIIVDPAIAIGLKRYVSAVSLPPIDGA